MAHINELIDYTVVVYIVFKNKVLLIDHKELKKWLPLGGHIELDEDPEQAAIREAKEESGLDVEIIAEKPDIVDPNNKILYTPEYLDIHKVSATHQHVGIVYFARAKSANHVLAEKEHNHIKWLTSTELDDPKYNLGPAIKFYAKKALQKLA